MSCSAKAAVAEDSSGRFSISDIELGPLRDHEVKVGIQACGVCHTDLKALGRLELPAVLGHEGTGLIEEVGRKVRGFGVGDRVLLSYPWCGQCHCCAQDRPYHCKHIPALNFHGSRLDGSRPLSRGGKPLTSAFFQQSSFATKAIVSESNLVRIESDMPPALVAALTCGVQTGAGAILNTFKVERGESVAIIGVGAVGLSAVMAAHHIGAQPIIALDLNQDRLNLALELGATHAFDASDIEAVGKAKKVMPEGATYVLETSASVKALEQAIELLGQGGTVGIVAPPAGGKPFNFNGAELFYKVGRLECIVQGSAVARRFIPELIALHDAGRFPFEKLITTYPLSEIAKAFNDAQTGKAIKPVLCMDN